MISVKRAAAITCLCCFDAPLSVEFAEKKQSYILMHNSKSGLVPVDYESGS